MLIAQNLVEYGLLDYAASAVTSASTWLTVAASYNRDTLQWLAIAGVGVLLAMKLFSRR